MIKEEGTPPLSEYNQVALNITSSIKLGMTSLSYHFQGFIFKVKPDVLLCTTITVELVTPIKPCGVLCEVSVVLDI